MKTKYFIIALFSLFASPCQMKEGYSIKLVGSSLSYAGRVQIRNNGADWKSICDAGWDRNDARVVCRQLGYSEAEAAILGEAFGPAPGEVVAKEFQCHGNEQFLSKCYTNIITKIRCRNNTVAAVLCKPNVSDLPVYIMICLIGCLVLTSIIILIVTYKTMRKRRRFLPATDSKIVVSNPNNEENIEKALTTEGERGMNEIGNSVSSSDFSYFEENIPLGEEAVSNDEDKKDDGDDKKDKVLGHAMNPELIESISSVEAHNRDNDEQAAKHKASKKGRYMSLLKGSRAFLQFYEKLLKKNRIHEATTEVDYPEDYYSSYQYSKDWLDKDVHDSNDIDSSSTDEYNEIYSEKVKEKVDKDVLEYTPMLSFSHIHFQEVAIHKEGPHDEYLDILPPNDCSKEIPSRDSDYLDPVETNLPAFPETSDDVASCTYDAELPQPPSDLLTSTGKDDDQTDERNRSPANKLGLINRGCTCKCKKDLMCKNCLDIHFVANHTKLDLEQVLKTKLRGSKEKEDEDESEYVPMDLCETENKGAEVEEIIRRNSANYAIPVKKHTKDKRDQSSSFPEELNKKILNLKDIKEPNNNEMNHFTIKSEEKEEARKEKDYKMLASPRNARKAIENEKSQKENSGILGKSKPKLSPKPSFSKSKNYFENNITATQNRTKKMGDFPKRLFKSEEKESNLETPSLADNDGEKARSESCPVESTNRGKPNTSFLEVLENALKASGSREEIEKISGQKQEDIDTENKYELDYEDILSPTDSKYENDDFYSGSRSGSRPGSDDYDYVHEKQRSSLHFYEAVSKHSDEFEEDEYENI